MKGLLEFKELLYTNGITGFIVSLKDGRCALVDIETGYVDVDVFLDIYLKWGRFDSIESFDKIEEIKKVLEKSKKVYFSSLAEDYLKDIKIKEKIDILKKNAGYNY